MRASVHASLKLHQSIKVITTPNEKKGKYCNEPMGNRVMWHGNWWLVSIWRWCTNHRWIHNKSYAKLDYFRHQIENILVSHHIKNNYRMQETPWKSTYRFNVRQWLNEVCNCKCKQEDDQLERRGDTKKTLIKPWKKRFTIVKVLELLKETGGTGDSERTGLKGVIYEIKQKRRLSLHKPFESLSSVMAFRLLRFFF